MSRTDSFLGAPAVERVWTRALPRRLRVLAYHGVPDPSAFGRHLAHLTSSYHVVSGAQVAAALDAGAGLPDRAVWITFDDGRPDVVENGLPELGRFGMPATLFVCGGLVDGPSPFWWSIVEGALVDGPLEFDGRTWTDRRLVTHLKTVEDRRRRDFVEGLAPSGAIDTSVGRAHLATWIDAGLEVGNHTWDHPCLDRCDPLEQRRQIVESHDRLAGVLGHAPTLFAYPNGDVTAAAKAALREAGYQLALAFDHRLADLAGDRFEMSRFRVDSNAPIDRFRAILGGAHSAFFHARSGVRRVVGRG